MQGQELLEKILRHVGFVRLDKLPAVALITWVYPEIIVLLSSITVLVVCKKMTSQSDTVQTNEEGETAEKSPKKRNYGFLVTIREYKSLLKNQPSQFKN